MSSQELYKTPMKRLDLISNVLSLLNPTLVEEKATIT